MLTHSIVHNVARSQSDPNPPPKIHLSLLAVKNAEASLLLTTLARHNVNVVSRLGSQTPKFVLSKRDDAV